jgi:hypothetical protein
VKGVSDDDHHNERRNGCKNKTISQEFVDENLLGQLFHAECSTEMECHIQIHVLVTYKIRR